MIHMIWLVKSFDFISQVAILDTMDYTLSTYRIDHVHFLSLMTDAEKAGSLT